MSPDRLPHMLGIIVCAVVVLGLDAEPMTAMLTGMFFGGLAHYGLALAMHGRGE